MPVTPPTNLSSNSAPWGRWATTEIEQLNKDSLRYQQDQVNNSKQLNSSINAINQQIIALQDQQATLAAQQLLLAQQQATLEAQQETLQGAVNNIAAQQVQINNAISALQTQQAYIASLQPVSQSSAIGTTSFNQDTWATGSMRPSVSINATTGRVKVTMSALCGGAQGYFSMTGASSISRDSQRSGNKAADCLGAGSLTTAVGASKEWFVNVANGTITVTAEFYAGNGTAGLVGYPSISIQNVG